MYLLGLSGFRTRRRGTAVLSEAFELVRVAGDGWLVFDRSEDPHDPIDSRRRSNDLFEVYGAALLSAVLAVAVDPRRCK